MTLQSFIFGKSQKYQTPEELERARKTVKDIYSGIGTATGKFGWLDSLSKGAVAGIMNHRIKKGEEQAGEQRAAGNSLAERFISGFGLTPSPAYPESVAAGGSPTAGVATGTVPATPEAETIRSGLMDRGLPQHVADAFVMNFQDESGLNPGINEASPTVPGSRGGYGLYQLTGPRRREYETFASQRGVDPANVDAQLDFLMTELQGSEAGAAKSILSAPDTGSAAAAIVNDFLRPAPEHRQQRANKYLSSGQDVQVASLDPSIGMPSPDQSQPMPQQSPYPEQGQVPPHDFTGNPQLSAGAGIPFQGDQQQKAIPQQQQAIPQHISNQTNAVSDALLRQNDIAMGGALAPQGQQTPQQMTDASGAFPPAPTGQPFAQTQPPQSNRMQEFAQIMSNPWIPDEMKATAKMMMQQEMQNSDPARQLDMDYKRAQIEKLKSNDPSASSSFGNLDAQARAAGLSPGTPEYQSFMLNGGGDPATFRALDLQAKAAGFQPGTPQYNEFMATRGAGLSAGAAQSAKNAADIQTGGAAAGAVDLGKATIKAGTDAWGDYGKLQTSLGNLDEAISALDSGAKSGIVYNMLPNVTEASASLENAMNRMGLDVIGSVTFGALSEGEMHLAMNTAVPRNLGPDELKSWLVKKRDAQSKAATMLADAARYLTVPGNTINGWIEKNTAGKTSSQGDQERSTPAPSGTRLRFNPQTGDFE